MHAASNLCKHALCSQIWHKNNLVGILHYACHRSKHCGALRINVVFVPCWMKTAATRCWGLKTFFEDWFCPLTSMTGKEIGNVKYFTSKHWDISNKGVWPITIYFFRRAAFQWHCTNSTHWFFPGFWHSTPPSNCTPPPDSKLYVLHHREWVTSALFTYCSSASLLCVGSLNLNHPQLISSSIGLPLSRLTIYYPMG